MEWRMRARDRGSGVDNESKGWGSGVENESKG